MSIFKKGWWIRTVTTATCPACQEGDFFISKNPYDFRRLGEIHKNCPECGQRYSLEPGFYFGAAYVSYALNVALMVACGVAVYVLIEETEAWHYLSAIFGMTLLLFPVIFRLSRLIWAAMFIPWGGEKKQFNRDGNKAQ